MFGNDSRAGHVRAAHGGLLVKGVRAMVMSGLDGWSEWTRIVHRSMLRKRRHGIWRSVAGWLAGCIHCIVEPDQASGGGPDRKYREVSGAFLGVELGRTGEKRAEPQHGEGWVVCAVCGSSRGVPNTAGSLPLANEAVL